MKFILFFIFSFILSISSTETSQTSGSCGSLCNWEYASGSLTITGSGEMNHYYTVNKIPWYSFRNEITSISITGISSIGNKAFEGLLKLTSVTFDSQSNSLVQLEMVHFIILI